MKRVIRDTLIAKKQEKTWANRNLCPGCREKKIRKDAVKTMCWGCRRHSAVLKKNFENGSVVSIVLNNTGHIKEQQQRFGRIRQERIFRLSALHISGFGYRLEHLRGADVTELYLDSDDFDIVRVEEDWARYL